MDAPKTAQDSSKPKPRLDKTIGWLEESRNSWKEKTVKTKDELKKKKLAVKRARMARDELKDQLIKREEALQEAQKQLSRKDQEIDLLKRDLEDKQRKIDDLKKKSSAR